MYKLPTLTSLLTRSAALELAKARNMPVVVPNEWLRWDVAYPSGVTRNYDEWCDYIGALECAGFNDYLVQNIDTFVLSHARRCPSCRRWYPVSEFQNAPYYCRHSEGMETPEDNEECRACIQDANAHDEMVARKECFV